MLSYSAASAKFAVSKVPAIGKQGLLKQNWVRRREGGRDRGRERERVLLAFTWNMRKDCLLCFNFSPLNSSNFLYYISCEDKLKWKASVSRVSRKEGIK